MTDDRSPPDTPLDQPHEWAQNARRRAAAANARAERARSRAAEARRQAEEADTNEASVRHEWEAATHDQAADLHEDAAKKQRAHEAEHADEQ